MNILFVINILSKEGAASAMLDLIKGLKNDKINCEIFAQYGSSEDIAFYQQFVGVIKGDSHLLSATISENKHDLVHWFRTNSGQFFNEFTNRGLRNTIPVVMTLCQVPAEYSLRLNLNELKWVDHFIFICNSAFNHQYHTFIESTNKTRIYFGQGEREIFSSKELEAEENQMSIEKETDQQICIRGSQINRFKIPKNLFKVMGWIRTSNFKFIVVGSGENSLLEERTSTSLEIEHIEGLSGPKWYNLLAQADIYTYHLPKSSYSAIDTTIQHAMSQKLPIVYLGPSGPSELIDHGISGFIARSESEYVEYIELVLEDEDLKMGLGNKSKEKLDKDFSYKSTISEHRDLYEMLLKNTKSINKPRKIPIGYSITFTLDSVKNRIRKLVWHGE